MHSKRSFILICVLYTICGSYFRGVGEAQTAPGAPRVLDTFESTSGWSATPSDGVTLVLKADRGHQGQAMRLDFDFHGHGGYAVAHKAFPLDLPENFAITFWIRGEAPVNNLEFKLIDSSGANVWWLNQRNVVFPTEWKKVVIRRRQIEFAWGPVGGGSPRGIAAIELAITAGTGGQGRVWIDDLQLEPRPPEVPYDLTPETSASHSAPNHSPSLAIDNDSLSAWWSGATEATAWLELDFLKAREFGGIIIDWAPHLHATDYAVALSEDGRQWTAARRVSRGNGGRDYLYLPESEARYLRLELKRSASQGYGIRAIRIEPLEWSKDLNAFFHAIARDAPRGRFPRYFQDQQSYWTIVGVSGDGHRALLGQDGAIEPQAGGFSVEPFVRMDGRTLSWADAPSGPSLLDDYLPIPSIERTVDSLSLTVTAFASGRPGASAIYPRYRVTNRSHQVLPVTLFLAVRPFQVNPPWQFLGTAGGVARVDSLQWNGRSVRVNGVERIETVTAATSFGAASFDQGDISEFLAHGQLPGQSVARDPFGHASGVLAYRLSLPPNGARDVYLRFPESERQSITPRGGSSRPSALLAAAARTWRAELNRVSIELPPSARPLQNALRSTLAYMLINRDSAAIQPGARSYRRSWIRDGAMIGSAFLRMNHPEPVREFLEWYAPYQYESGKVPCCVDARGADPVPEHDSHGELIYLVTEYYRATGDRVFLEKMWPHVARAVGYIDSLRQTQQAPQYQAGDQRRFFGLMPPSISHEGYSARPVHSYWDDFFVLTGLIDAADLALLLGHDRERFSRIRDEFRHDLLQSIRATIAGDRLDYIPGSAELGDYDPTSTSIGITPGGQEDSLPAEVLAHTYRRYLREVHAREDSTGWDGYTPYELRNVGALVRLGFRAQAWDLLQLLFRGRRPAAWNQWPEVVWRDSAAPKFLGDLPHTWVGSDFVRSFLDMLAYVRPSDSTLVVAAGVPAGWVTEEPGISVKDLPIGRGKLDMTMSGNQTETRVRLSGTLLVPPGGIQVYAPFDWKATSVGVDGTPAVLISPGSVVVRQLPSDIVFRRE
jgi:hypothetical protein